MHAVRTTSRHPVCRVVFSPCGGYYAAAQPHHGVTLHDRGTGEPVRTFGNPRRPDYTGLTFWNGGGWFVAAGSKGIEVHAAATGAYVADEHRWFMKGLRVGVTGQSLLAAFLSQVWELVVRPDFGGIDRRLFWTGEQTFAWELAPDGRWGIGLRRSARPVVADLTARRASHALDHPARDRQFDHGHPGRPAVGFAPAGRRVAIGDGRSVSVFDLELAPGLPADSGEAPAPLPVTSPVFTLAPPDRWPADRPWQPPFALTPDGRGLLVKRPRERVQFWDVDAGTLAAEWSWRLEGVTCLAVAPDGLTAVAGGRFGRVLTWDLV